MTGDSSPPDESAEDILSSISDTARKALRKGKAAGDKVADRSLPVVKRSISKATYCTCYYFAFGLRYSTRMVLGLLPEDSSVRLGLRDGTEAADQVYAARQMNRSSLVIAKE